MPGPVEVPEIRLRGYERADLDAIFHLDELCFEKPFRFTKRDMRRFAEARNAQVLIAHVGAELAAFSIVHREQVGGEPAGYLLTLDVSPAFRRRRLAELLLRRSEEETRAARCQAMSLHVFTENAAAIALYEKRGYTRLGLVERFYGAGLHAWVFRKPL